MKKIITAFFVATMLLVACKASKEVSTKTSNKETITEKWIIASKKLPCGEEKIASCYQVKVGSELNYNDFNAEIVGFNYEEGYKYQIEVKKVVSKKEGTSYVLIKELFKIEHKK